MLETKYGLKYPMPHVLVHIVDNSAYTASKNIEVADDPSMYSTLVVSGLPMGEDRRVLNINRSDILNVAFGLGSLGTDDIMKYGQSAVYPLSLIKQGAPVKLLRVTPDDACYAYTCIVMEWRWNTTENVVEVRFNTGKLDDERSLKNFANKDRLNAAIVKAMKDDNIPAEEGDPCQVSWKRRAFITGISAGRGSIYNNFSIAVNQTVQGKRPSNVQYLFTTTDLTKNSVVEQFYASLVNLDANKTGVESIETVNVAVKRRAEGSSIVVPYVNEAAVKELYAEYHTRFGEMLESDPAGATQFMRDAYTHITVNTFDPVFGLYIYGGTDLSVQMPYFRVDMRNSDLQMLPSSNLVYTLESDITNSPELLNSKILPLTVGIGSTGHDGDPVTVGDMFLYSGTTTMNNPYVYIVGQINQYSGSVTTVKTNKVKIGTGSDDPNTERTIATIIKVQDSNDNGLFPALTARIKSGVLRDGDAFAIAYPDTKTWKIGYLKSGAVASVQMFGSVDRTYVVYNTGALATPEDVLKNLVFPSNSGNIIARSSSDIAWNKIGATRLDQSTGAVSIVSYGGTSAEPATINVGTGISLNYGPAPATVDTTSDVVGTEFDLIQIIESSLYPLVTSTTAPTWEASTYYTRSDDGEYTLQTSAPNDWATNFTNYYTRSGEEGSYVYDHVIAVAPTWEANKYYKIQEGQYVLTTEEPANWETNYYTDYYTKLENISDGAPSDIVRYVVSGSIGSLFRVQPETAVSVPTNYYSDSYGIDITEASGGVRLESGSSGFFDNPAVSTIQFKWNYSLLLTKAYRGQVDPRILSPNRVNAKYLFDGGTNTVIGQEVLPSMVYTVEDLIYASTIFTDEEKDSIMEDPTIITWSADDHDIDVKQAMYDLLIYRVYEGMPEEMRPVGPGSGMSLHLDAGITDSQTALLINQSFGKRFDNPNASWDIGGYVSSADGITYTNTKRLADNLIAHCKNNTVNKPFTGNYSKITPDEYVSYFPDIDTTDWDYRALIYNSGGNAWIPDVNGNLIRRSQRTLMRGNGTSDLIQESNMRTLSQLIYLLKNKLEEKLFEYNDDSVLKTTSDEVNNMFSGWVGNLVQSLDINFVRDTNPTDGADIVVCYVDVVFRGINLRIPVIVNVNRRTTV